MRILVLVKQVPELGSIRYVEQLNRIERSGVAARCNPLDLHALAHALALKSACGAEVVVATMGPPDARQVLDEAIRLGADRAVHVVDFVFAGADTLATARALATLVRREEPDLVLCGRNTLDGGTAQVGPQLAELACLDAATEAVGIRVLGGTLEVDRETRSGHEVLTLDLPALVSFERGPELAPAAPAGRLASAPASASDAVLLLDAEGLGGDLSDYGIRGSATYVRSIEQIPERISPERITDPAEGLSRLDGLSRRQRGTTPSSGPADLHPAGASEIWVVVEPDGELVAPVSLEALACAEAVAGRIGARVVAVMLESEARKIPELLASAGAHDVLHARSEDLAPYSPAACIAALDRLLELRRPLAVLGGWTRAGREWLPRVAARNGLGMTGDFIGLDLDPRPGQSELLDLVWLKPAWSGTAIARVVARSVPSFGTLRPGCFSPLPPVPTGAPVLEVVELGPLDLTPGPRSVRREDRGEVRDDLDNSRVVVLVGSRLSDDDLAGAAMLARRLGGALGGTRGAVAAGLVEPYLEVSPASRSLSPALLVALGLDGTIDLVPVSGARVVAVVGASGLEQCEADLFIDCATSSLLDLLRR